MQAKAQIFVPGAGGLPPLFVSSRHKPPTFIHVQTIDKYRSYLLLEKGLSANTCAAYVQDVTKLVQYLGNNALIGFRLKSDKLIKTTMRITK